MWGELCIAGQGVAEGYINRPGLSATRFVKNPSAHHPDECIYRSADIGRILPSGEIEYLGRIDNQLKINGNCIEPGEVETVLRRHPAIRNAVVLGRGGRVSSALDAWLELQPGFEMPEISALKTWLRQRLPAHMIPANFFDAGHIPLNQNGKTDRRHFARAPESSKTTPSDETQETLQSIWEDVLKIDSPGIDDDFLSWVARHFWRFWCSAA